MEGGSPSLIWQRWTIPMLQAYRRYRGDHPTLEQIAAAYFKIKPKYTPPASNEKPKLDWSLLEEGRSLHG